MPSILQLLKTNRAIKSYTILDFKQRTSYYFFKVTITLIDNTELHIREFFSFNERNYSYHWQDAQGKLIIRWDNAPHHNSLPSAPHHKHTPKVESSYDISLNEVLKYIEGVIIEKP